MADVRVLLDVDGVLNAYDHGDSWPEWRQGVARSWNGTFALTWAPPVAEFFSKLHQAGVEVMWLSTWGTTANGDVCELLGLPQLRVAGTVMDGHDREWWWKLQVAARWYRWDHKPFVWIDDELRRYPDAVEWGYGLPDGDCLLVNPALAVSPG